MTLKSIDKYSKYLLFSLLMVIGFAVLGQSKNKLQKQFDKARIYYSSGDVKAAIDEATILLTKNPEFVDAALLLADIYNEIDSVALEIDALEKALEYSDNTAIFYRLAKASYASGFYKKAKENFESYLQIAQVTEVRKTEVRRMIANCDFAIEAQLHPVEFKPIRLSNNINSANDEYWPSLSLDQKELVFTRLLKITGHRPQEDFFISEYKLDDWGLAQPIIEINTSNNEGAQSLSVNGRFLLFTACNRGDGFGSCDIYFSERSDGKWRTARNVGAPANSKAWESQPSFSSDNKYLYFSSNRKGGKGKKDIWRSEFQGIGAGGKILWGEPENLGDSINTPGDEISPFIHANNKSFYFASDYRTGMGGFDLFSAELKEDETFTEAKNIGFPINTYEDEQGLNISADGTTAFFSSARNPETGLDIFTFELEKKMRPEPVTYAKIKVSDADTEQPVRAKIELVNLYNEKIKRSETGDNNGEALLCFPVGAQYAFDVSEKGYLFYSQSFEMDDSRSISKPYLIDIKLQPIKIGAEMNLYNIYFETDSFKILPESTQELQKLINLINLNSRLKIEIQGHTDNTGIPLKNKELSDLRAQSVFNYLVDKGIKKDRLSAKGYGQNFPVVSNETKEGRKLNRRTTIKVIAK